ncbi:PREDICTED: uncharacterized protein LOC109125974 [Camelina sativa]|uniref:Uncharacterized protein LOC109125974 n=1 Tax=Camelina sativa TaxID=90675 RepID=A0ABM1QC67_CAMSA|nr:PREDICTED: uncharacterized protein LOC109125974 [Camelina sativa]
MDFPPHFVTMFIECITTPTFSVSVNGESCGYFKGAKGLRQGDSISPYLFTNAMEVFTQILNRGFTDNLIGHHPSAITPQVTHLAFADDIMIFYDGGVNQNETSRNASLGFNLGSLPIHYLGLPLMHRKLRISDYRPLLDKITA